MSSSFDGTLRSPVLETAPAASQGWLAGGGEMGALIRAFDWAAHPMGRPETWPQSLRTALSICLGSRFPMALWWGPELRQFYNDGYVPVLGGKHPRSLGQRGDVCWEEIWGVVGSHYRQVMTTGVATFASDLLLLMERSGYLEETYFTFSYSPIRDEGGGVAGNLITCEETTGRVLGERRLRTLRDLAAGSSDRVEDACAKAAGVLAANAWDLPFALIYLLDGDGQRLRLACASGLPEGSDAAPLQVDLGEPDGPRGWPLAVAIREGRPVQVDGLAARFRVAPAGPWPDPPRAALLLPLAAPGQECPAGVLVAGVNRRRELDDSYRSFVELIAGQIATAVANARAYEEARRRAEALAEIDRAKTAFFSNVSHEFRTPLTLLLGPLSDALADADQPLAGGQRERIATAQRNALRLLKLVNMLLDFSRLEAGRAEAVFEPTDLAILTRDLASAFTSAVERAGLRFEVDCPPLGAEIYADPEMWEKILFNLLSNALKFTLEGEIAVRLRLAGDHAELTVSDTGTGIPAAEIPHLFERFHRVRTARARSYEGSGIGLALVAELVKLHGGSVRAESEDGRGTTFIVAIPAGRAHLPADRIGTSRTLASTAIGAAPFVEEALRWLPASPVGTAPGGDPGDPAQHARVLLADDNSDMREYVQRLLAGRWAVEAVGDGAVALERALADPPDLLLADVMMPGFDGFELLRALRADSRTHTLPVILLSARAGEESRIEGLDAGADDYLVKPFSARELVARVGAQLAASRERRELLAHEQSARREAESQSRARDQFLAMLSHELRNPLGAISAAAHTLEDRVDGEERRLSRIIARQSLHLARLLDDLLDVARVTAGKIELRRGPVDLAEIVERCRRALETGGRHRISVDAEPAWVDGDATRLEQVVTNLFENAVKYTPAGGAIRVRLRADSNSGENGGEAVLSVEDEGIGISPEKLTEIFDLFVQGDREPDRREGGMGLGLTLVRQLVAMHGGRVEARSEGEGKGSEFVVRLPLATHPSAAAAGDGGGAVREAGRRILVIEDHDDAREALCMLLELDGHQVEAAEDGPRGLEKVGPFEPDLVLLDIGLPGLDGYEVARALAGHPARGRMRVVALTGYGQESDRRRTQEAGFDAHLVKPVEPARLREVIAGLGAMPEGSPRTSRQ